jgi:hypothetical protein
MLRLVSPLIRRPLLPVLGIALGLALGGAALTVPSAHAQDDRPAGWGEDCILDNGLMLPEGVETNQGIFRVRCVNGQLVIVGIASVTAGQPGARPVMQIGVGGAALAR